MEVDPMNEQESEERICSQESWSETDPNPNPNKHRGAKLTADHKKKLNFIYASLIYANSHLKLTNVSEKSHQPLQ